jgi:hypothetical protein
VAVVHVCGIAGLVLPLPLLLLWSAQSELLALPVGLVYRRLLLFRKSPILSMQIQYQWKFAKKKSKIFGRVNKKKQICFFFKPHPEIGKFFSNNHHHHTSCPAIKPDLTQKIKAVFVRSQWSE